jgi:hypothetical protein
MEPYVWSSLQEVTSPSLHNNHVISLGIKPRTWRSRYRGWGCIGWQGRSRQVLSWQHANENLCSCSSPKCLPDRLGMKTLLLYCPNSLLTWRPFNALLSSASECLDWIFVLDYCARDKGRSEIEYGIFCSPDQKFSRLSSLTDFERDKSDQESRTTNSRVPFMISVLSNALGLDNVGSVSVGVVLLGSINS